MRITHEPITSDIIDMELIELKFIFDRSKQLRSGTIQCIHDLYLTAHHDNRDFDIFANYQPRLSDSVNTQTLLLGGTEGVGLVLKRLVSSAYFLNLSPARMALDIPQIVHTRLPTRK